MPGAVNTSRFEIRRSKFDIFFTKIFPPGNFASTLAGSASLLGPESADSGDSAKNSTVMATTTLTAPKLRQTRGERIFELEFYPLLDAVYTFAYRLTGDAVQADDLVQDTYLKAWKFVDRYTEATNAKAWLFRICRNVFINGYRQKTRQPYKVDYQDIVVYHNEDDPSTPRYFGLHEEMGQRLIGDEVARAINALSPGFRVVVLLDLEDFTYEEIAAIANIPIGTVRSRLHRARNILAAKLRNYAEAQGYATATETGSDHDDEPQTDDGGTVVVNR
jgi:RNA polymerase sigma factor (sigma-70 family)